MANQVRLEEGNSLLMQVLAMLTVVIERDGHAYQCHVALLTNGMHSIVPRRPMSSKFDLKGHTVGRQVKQMARTPSTPLQDVEFAEMSVKLDLEARSALIAAIEADLSLLSSAVDSSGACMGLMDYSLLLGIQTIDHQGAEETEDPGVVIWRAGSAIVTGYDCTHRYYFTIIDTATEFDAKKSFQCTISSLFGKFAPVSASAQYPADYAERFLNMCVTKIIVGGHE